MYWMVDWLIKTTTVCFWIINSMLIPWGKIQWFLMGCIVSRGRCPWRSTIGMCMHAWFAWKVSNLTSLMNRSICLFEFAVYLDRTRFFTPFQFSATAISLKYKLPHTQCWCSTYILCTAWKQRIKTTHTIDENNDTWVSTTPTYYVIAHNVQKRAKLKYNLN